MLCAGGRENVRQGKKKRATKMARTKEKGEEGAQAQVQRLFIKRPQNWR